MNTNLFASVLVHLVRLPYRTAPLPCLAQLAWAPLGVRGRVYVASEGINAQMAVPCTSTKRFQTAVDAVEKLAGV